MQGRDWVTERVDRTSLRKVADELGFHHSTIRRWMRGEALPSSEQIARVDEVAGQELDWGLRRFIPPDIPEDATARERARIQVKVLEDERNGWTQATSRAERRAWGVEYGRAVQLLARVSGEGELAAGQILKSRDWARIKEAVARGCKGFPQVMRAIARELRKLDGHAAVGPEPEPESER